MIIINVKLVAEGLDGFARVRIRRFTAREEMRFNRVIRTSAELDSPDGQEDAILEACLAALDRHILAVEAEGDWPALEGSPSAWADACGQHVVDTLTSMLRPTAPARDLGK